MTIEEANKILDSVDRLSLLAAEIVVQVLEASGRSAADIRAQRDAISADTHGFVAQELARLEGAGGAG